MAKSEVIAVQVVFMGFIFAMAFLSGLLPNLLPWCRKNRVLMGIANAFSGGVFLAIALMHILPEAASEYDEYLNKDTEEEHAGEEEEGHDHAHEFALPYALAFIGYALILLIDKVVFDTHSLTHQSHDQCKDVQEAPKETDRNMLENSQEEDVKDSASRNSQFVSKMSGALHDGGQEEPNQGIQVNAIVENCKEEKDQENQSKVMNESETKSTATSSNINTRKLFNFTPIVLMIGLSIHSIFEGIVFGLEGDIKNLWSYILAISLHKWAAAMSLGFSMSKSFKGQNLLVFILLTIFSIATPLGIAIGMLASDSSVLTEVILSSLAGGTFLYIACSEVIVEEFSNPKHKYLKMGMFLVGAALITGFIYIEF